MVREGNDPTRRFAKSGTWQPDDLAQLADRLTYDGEGHHKLHPGDYGFHPPVSPRPTKDVCDGVRPVLKSEAQQLFKRGIQKGMVSAHSPGDNPKYVWSVGRSSMDVVEVWEAKESRAKPGHYHGYGLKRGTVHYDYILKEWTSRCGRP